MRAAVMTLTRDRLAYTQTCFALFSEYAGISFDHFVLDNGSTDGTPEWLLSQFVNVTLLDENIGLHRGFNRLLKQIDTDAYDVIVRIDNDCELTQPNTLRDICKLTLDGGALLSPRILGLRNPPQFTSELVIGDEVILDIPQIGGIFIAAPAWVYDEFAYPESAPKWGLDDVAICRWFRSQGGTCGYVKRFEAWHYESTDGQAERYPEYVARKEVEMAA